MSVSVSLEELEKVLDTFGSVSYLLSTGSDLRPHVTSVLVELSEQQLRCGLGRVTTCNALERSKVSFLWPPCEPGGYSFIVDGDIEVIGSPGEDAVGVVTITCAVLHRSVE